MSDQAEQLRKMVRARNHRYMTHGGHHVLGILGGQVGAGVTTIALNLAIALARRNSPVVLVDLNFEKFKRTWIFHHPIMVT